MTEVKRAAGDKNVLVHGWQPAIALRPLSV